MLPETDARHGTVAGYGAGCRNWCCWQIKQRYDKRRRWEARQGFARKVPVLGALRRIQALRAMGWSVTQISARAGMTTSQMYDIGRHGTLYATTHRRIAEAYEAMADEQPHAETVNEKHALTKTLRTAARKGWPTPDRWFDIDDPAEQPDPGWRDDQRPRDDFDQVIVDRIIGGDRTLTGAATRPERVAVVARWPGTYNDLERLTGWKLERYRGEVAESA